jgi:L-lysine exporter family protein LysE/ArgO
LFNFDSISMTLALLAIGATCGFCSSAPLGPINIWIADQTLANKRNKLSWFLSGVIAADIIFASIAAWGYYEFFQNGVVKTWLPLIGGSFLILLGLSGFRKTKTTQLETNVVFLHKNRSLTSFSLGAFLCGSNPAFLLFWIFVFNQVDLRLSANPDTFQLLIFLIGVALGDLIWFRIFIHLISKGMNLLKPKIILYIRFTISAMFFAFGAYVIAQIYW